MSIAAVSWAFKQKVNDPIAKLVLIGIADKYNEERGYAWPSVKWLAEVADCTTRTVQSKIKLLEEVGMLVRVMQKNGKTNDTNHYHIPPLGGGENPSGVNQLLQGGGEAVASGGGVKQPVHPNYSNNYINNKYIIDSFDLFWNVVPKKVGKKAALKAFKNALKDAEPDAIMAGMNAYADKVTREKVEPKFICHPSTWLNEGRWDDEETAAPASTDNFGVSRRWTPATQDEFLAKFNAMPDYYRMNRPDIIAQAKQNGWLNE